MLSTTATITLIANITLPRKISTSAPVIAMNLTSGLFTNLKFYLRQKVLT